MNLLEHSLLVLSKDWPGNLGLLAILFLGGGAVFFGLLSIFRENLTLSEYLALGVSGWFVPILLWVLLVGLINFIFKIKTDFLWGWGLIFCAAAWFAWRAFIRRSTMKVSRKLLPVLGLFLFILFSVFSRLAFIWDLQVPLYFDSAMHYSVTQDLIRDFASFDAPVFQSFVGGYYHLGFHALVASFSLVLHQPVQNVMLFFGQVILALIPVPLFFIVRHETKLTLPALFAVLLAGWAWYMPAHMLDWGKYPALTSVLSFEFAICCLILFRQAVGRQRLAMLILVFLSILLSTFIHSRSLVIIGLAIASHLIAVYWQRLPRSPKIILASLIAAGLAALAFFIQTRPVLRLALDPYLGGQAWMVWLVLVLLPMAWMSFPRATFTCLVFTFFLLGSLFVSVMFLLPTYAAQTLLDRPYVEGVLFFPLAVFGGLGYAGLVRTLQNRPLWQTSYQQRAGVLIAFCLFGTLSYQIGHYNFYPSACCKIFAEQDAAAFEWLDGNSPANATILIASFETIVFETTQPAGFSGADAGIWITPFIHREVVLARYDVDFTSRAVFEDFCRKRVNYIYAGWTSQSFNVTLLEEKPEWYARQLVLPGIQVYHLINCP